MSLIGTDEQVTEGYQDLTKKQINTIKETITKIIVFISRKIIDFINRKNVPIKKETVENVDKIVSGFKYQKTLPIIKLTGLTPNYIINSKTVIVYNEKYNSIGMYLTKPGGFLSIDGRAITGYDKEKSLWKRLKRNTSIIKEVIMASAEMVPEILDKIHTKTYPMNGYGHAAQVILKTIR